MNGWRLGVALGLVLANAFFVSAEFSLVAARRTRMEQLAASGSRRARAALAPMRDLNTMLAGSQLGIGMASLGLGFLAEPAMADVLRQVLDPLGVHGRLAHGLAVGAGLLVVVSVHTVVGEMVPKNISIAEPEAVALAVAAPFRAYLGLFGPVLRMLTWMAGRLLRALGFEARDELAAAHSADEIASMVRASRSYGAIQDFEHRLLTRALGLARLDAAAVMTPRPDLVAVPRDATPAAVERLVARTGHSRLPVYGRDLDDVVGFVHVKDLLGVPDAARDEPLPTAVVRDLLVVPESRSLVDLLADMRRQRAQLVLVADEHGGTAGVATLEDVLEELVGEIRDEHDPAAGHVWRVGPRRVLLDAGLRLDEVERAVGLALPPGDYETVAGFLLARLGRVPEVGDAVVHEGWNVRVRRMDGRRVELVELVSPPGVPDRRRPGPAS